MPRSCTVRQPLLLCSAMHVPLTAPPAPCPRALLPCSCLPGTLRLLEVGMHSPPPALMHALRRHLLHAAVEQTAVCGPPAAHMWLPQLRSCQVHILTQADVAVVSAGLGPALPQLQSLTLIDRRPNALRGTLVLPGLELLPRLAKLVAVGSMPAQVWLCPQLTSLCLRSAGMWFPATATLRCPALRQLKLEGDLFPDGHFPRALCTASGLTGLTIIDALHSSQGHLLTLPAELRELGAGVGRGWGRGWASRGRGAGWQMQGLGGNCRGCGPPTHPG